MGFWSSLVDTVCAACSVITDVVTTIGSAIKDTAVEIANLGVNLAASVGAVIKSVGVLLGVIKPEDNLDELGEKAMMSEKTPEDFDSINDYIDHLRNDVAIDREKFDNLDEKDLLARSAIGASITLKAINDKLDTSVTPAFIATVAQQELEGAMVKSSV